MELQVGEYYWIKTRGGNLFIAEYEGGSHFVNGAFYALEISQYFVTDDVEVIQHIERPKV